MATPLGHSIIGYTIARVLGVRSPAGIAAAIGAANLPDVDFVMGFVSNGSPYSLHREVITHRRPFPFIVGAATGIAAAAISIARGRRPKPSEVIRPAALATALVGSHVAMDPLPLPYDDMAPRSSSIWDVVAGQAWNAVIDMAIYGTLAMAIIELKKPAKLTEA